MRIERSLLSGFGQHHARSECRRRGDGAGPSGPCMSACARGVARLGGSPFRADNGFGSECTPAPRIASTSSQSLPRCIRLRSLPRLPPCAKRYMYMYSEKGCERGLVKMSNFNSTLLWQMAFTCTNPDARARGAGQTARVRGVIKFRNLCCASTVCCSHVLSQLVQDTVFVPSVPASSRLCGQSHDVYAAAAANRRKAPKVGTPGTQRSSSAPRRLATHTR